MENIFENAYFGKAYKTRDGRKAVYLGDNTCWIEGGENEIGYSRNGLFAGIQELGIDIVSEWNEEINEEELNKLAMDASLKFPLLNPKEGKGVAFYKGYKAGYRKAMKNKK